MQFPKTLLLMTALGLICPLQALESIGWSYHRLPTSGPNTFLEPEELAGVSPYAQTNWNNHGPVGEEGPSNGQGPGPLPFPLVDNTGAATTASVTAWTLSLNNGWSLDGYTGDTKLMHSYSSNQPTLTFSGIPESYQESGYSVVIYYHHDGGSGQQPVTIEGSVDDFFTDSFTTSGNRYDNNGNQFILREIGSPTPTNSNCMVIPNLDDSEFTISLNRGLFALQIVKEEGAPAKPLNPLPEDWAFQYIAVSTNFSWSPSKRAESYDIYIWKDSETEPEVATATVTSPFYDPPVDLDTETGYHWKVVAKNSEGDTPGETWSFNTGDGGVPGLVGWPNPEDEEEGVSIDGMLIWDHADNAQNYELYLWVASETKPEEPIWTGYDIFYIFETSLLPNTTYKWQLVAINDVGETPGLEWTFTTSGFYDAGRESIGWNFATGYGGNGGMNSTSSIGSFGAGVSGYGQYHWNDQTTGGNQGVGGSTIPFNLKDSFGNVTTAQVTAFSVSSGDSWGHVAGNTNSGNSRMMATYVGANPSVTFSNIPSSYVSDGYSVLVYYENSHGSNHTITLSGSVNDARSLQIRTGDSHYDTEGFVLGTMENTSNYSNYTIFEGLDDPDFTISMAGRGFTGIQIVREMGPPNTPTNPLPAHTASEVATSTYLMWEESRRAETYDLYLWESSENEPETPTISGLTSPEYDPPSDLEASTAYSWRVVAVNVDGATEGPVWTFMTGDATAPAQAENPTPIIDATMVSLSPSFDWTIADRAASYEFFLWESDGIAPASPTATSMVPGYLHDSPLQIGTEYSWRVDTVNSIDRTTGQVWTFTTGTPPPAPVSPVPSDGTPDQALVYGKLDWADSAGTVSYNVYLWLSSETTPEIPTATVTASELLQTQALEADTSYSWRVDAVNDFGVSAGETWSFTTSSIVDARNSIGWKYHYSSGDLMEAGDVAGAPGYRQANWNSETNTQFPGPLFEDLVDSSGNATTATMTAWTTEANNGTPNPESGYRYYNGGNFPNPYAGKVPATDAKLTNSFTIPRPSITFSDIPYENYDVVIYYGNNDPGPAVTLELSDGDTQIASRTINTGGPAPGGNGQSGPFLIAPYAAGYVEATDITPSSTETNYTVFKNISLEELTIRILGGGTGISAIQIVETEPPSGNDYEDWATENGLVGADAAFDADPDNDGISNGIEFIIGGQPNPALPNSNSQHLLIPVEVDENHLIFSFTRTHLSQSITPIVEFSETLMNGDWTTALDPDNATISVVPGDTADTVTVAIPRNGASKLFVRLRAEFP